jgi:prepilin-type N-terminal cleavage/methylation domain-containing protein
LWNSKGYTLVELLAVIVINGILAGIAIPVYGHFIGQYREVLCEVTRMEMARTYEDFLAVEEIEHSSAAFFGFSH